MCWPKEIFITSSQDITFLASCKVDFSLKDTFSSPYNSPSRSDLFSSLFRPAPPTLEADPNAFTKKEIISSFLNLGTKSTEFLCVVFSSTVDIFELFVLFLVSLSVLWDLGSPTRIESLGYEAQSPNLS